MQKEEIAKCMESDAEFLHFIVEMQKNLHFSFTNFLRNLKGTKHIFVYFC